MKAQFMTWWSARSLREQRMLLVMIALIAITFLWFGLYRPVQDALSNARARHQEAVIRLGDVRAGAESLRSLPRSGPSLTGSVGAMVTQSAAGAGFANAIVSPQGDRRVTVSIPSARPAPLFGWIASLEAQGIVIERFSARANSDPTLSVEITMAGGC